MPGEKVEERMSIMREVEVIKKDPDQTSKEENFTVLG